MRRSAILLISGYFIFHYFPAFADYNDGWEYEYIDANVACKTPGKGQVKLVSMIYRVCDYDHVPEKGMISNSMFQLGSTAGQMCGGAYDVGFTFVDVSGTMEEAQRDHARALRAPGFQAHETFPFQFVYATSKCH